MNASRVAQRRALFTVLTLLGLGAPACIEGGVDVLVDAAAGTDGGATRGGTGADDVRDVRDGTSNTIAFDESPPAGDDEAAAGNASRGDAEDPPAAGDDAAPPLPPENPADDADPALDELTRALGDKFLTFGDSSFFSSGSITENSELQLCAFGRFAMRVTRITSTSFDTFSSESLFVGAWSVKAVNQQLLLELVVKNASDAADLGVQQRVVTFGGAGELFIDGARADIADAAADCATAAE